jgi:hypothetical protein
VPAAGAARPSPHRLLLRSCAAPHRLRMSGCGHGRWARLATRAEAHRRGSSAAVSTAAVSTLAAAACAAAGGRLHIADSAAAQLAPIPRTSAAQWSAAYAHGVLERALEVPRRNLRQRKAHDELCATPGTLWGTLGYYGLATRSAPHTHGRGTLWGTLGYYGLATRSAPHGVLYGVL